MQLSVKQCVSSMKSTNTFLENHCGIFFSPEAVCIFEGRTYFEGQRETVYSSSGDCVLFECKVRILLMEKKNSCMLEISKSY